MNIKEKIGQLFTVGFTGKKINKDLIKLIHKYHVGGVILFRENIGTPKELFQLTQDLQTEARKAGYKHPLLIATDEENGTVKRLGDGTDGYPGAMALSATQKSEYAYNVGNETGKQLDRFGINWNFAPVLDVNNNPDNPVIGVRSFGETPETVSEYGIRFMKGLQESGTATSLKHFPGHGDTNVDSHHDLPTINHDMKRLREIELKPFEEAISNGADCIMTAHISFPALEADKDLPATLSKNILTNLLRKDLSFEGIIVTDALEMDAISQTVGIDNGALKALEAGADNLLIGHYVDEQMKAIAKIHKAVEEGKISEKRIDESFNRMNSLKEKYLSWSVLDKEKIDAKAKFYDKSQENFAENIYEKSVSIIKEGETLLHNSSVLILQPKDELKTVAEDTEADDFTLTKVVKNYMDDVNVEIITNNITDEQKASIVEKVKTVDHIIIGTMTASKNEDIIEFINELSKIKKLNIVSMKSPYIGQWINNLNYWINTYEPNYIPIDIAVKTLLGDAKPTGVSPVTLNV